MRFQAVNGKRTETTGFQKSAPIMFQCLVIIARIQFVCRNAQIKRSTKQKKESF